MSSKNKVYNPRNKSVRYRKDVRLWITSRKVGYLYWFKYLQIAERELDREVDWRKYRGWGGSNVILGQKFDEWWEDRWVDLFGVANRSDSPKFGLSTKVPKYDAIRYALRLYENKHRGSTWEIAIWLKKNEKRIYFLDFFGKIDENLNTKTRLRREDPSSDQSYDDDHEAYLNRLGKHDVQRQVRRYLKYAERYLDNVCKGQFP